MVHEYTVFSLQTHDSIENLKFVLRTGIAADEWPLFLGIWWDLETKDFVRFLASRAQEYLRSATSDFKASADIINTKKVRRLAAVLIPLPSSVFYPNCVF
jgi:hypothetical protein